MRLTRQRRKQDGQEAEEAVGRTHRGLTEPLLSVSIEITFNDGRIALLWLLSRRDSCAGAVPYSPFVTGDVAMVCAIRMAVVEGSGGLVSQSHWLWLTSPYS